MRFILILILLIGICGASDYYGDINIRQGSNLSYVDGGGSTQTFDMETVPSSADGMIYNSTTSVWEILSLKYISNEIVVGPSSDGAKSILYDYTTDGIDDQVQINNALTSAHANGGGIIRLLEGTYTTSGEIDWPTTGRYISITLAGIGIGTRIVSTGDYPIINLSGNAGYSNDIRLSKICNMELRGTSTSEGYGIAIYNASANIFENLYIRNVNYGIWDNPGSYDSYFNQFRNIYLGSWGSGYGIGTACVYGDFGNCIFDGVHVYCTSSGCDGYYFTTEANTNEVRCSEIGGEWGKYGIYDSGYGNIWRGNYIEGTGSTCYFDGATCPQFSKNRHAIRIVFSNDTTMPIYEAAFHTAVVIPDSPSTIFNNCRYYRDAGEEYGKTTYGRGYTSDNEYHTDADAIGGHCQIIDTDEEAFAFYSKYLPYVMSPGKYNVSFRIKDTNGVASDINIYVYNVEDSSYVLPIQTVTASTSYSWYGPYEFNIYSTDASDIGESISFVVRKKTATANDIYIDCMLIDREGPPEPA